MFVREITAQDAGSYLALRVQSEREFPQYVGFNAERELAAGTGGIAGLIASYTQEGTVVTGVFDGARLIDVLVLSRRLSPKYRHKAFLWGMYVIPESRGTGAALALIEAAIAWATRQAEIIALSLQVTVSNVRGQRFYQQFGFQVFGTERRALFAAEQFHDVHLMELAVR